MREITRITEGIALRNVCVHGQRESTGKRRLEEARHRAQIALWQREIELMSAQLLADRVALESPKREGQVGLLGETHSKKTEKPTVRPYGTRKRVSAERTRAKNKKGTP